MMSKFTRDPVKTLERLMMAALVATIIWSATTFFHALAQF